MATSASPTAIAKAVGKTNSTAISLRVIAELALTYPFARKNTFGWVAQTARGKRNPPGAPAGFPLSGSWRSGCGRTSDGGDIKEATNIAPVGDRVEKIVGSSGRQDRPTSFSAWATPHVKLSRAPPLGSENET
jgi:hypothetical protein